MNVEFTAQEIQGLSMLEKQADRAKFLLERFKWQLRDKYGMPDPNGAQKLLVEKINEE